MKDDVMIDYSHPILSIEAGVRKTNDALLGKRYDEALDTLLGIVADTRAAYIAVRYIKEQEHALRKQAPPVQERVQTASRSW